MTYLVCYPQPNKGRSRDILRRFAAGCGGRVRLTSAAPIEDAPAAFFGVVGIEHLFNQARASGHDWYYIDNSYFDVTRKVFHRIGRNVLQDDGGQPNWPRFAALDIRIESWEQVGRHIVICPQSEHFMREVARWPGGANAWLEHVTAMLRQYTDRPFVIRPWASDKLPMGRTLRQDLKGAWALVTHMSAAANEAVLAGVPAFVTGPCAASRMGCADLSLIESPRRPGGRREWAAALAGKQWTLDEIGDGTAWRAIAGCREAA